MVFVETRSAVAASDTVIKGLKARAALASADRHEQRDVNPAGAGSLVPLRSNAWEAQEGIAPGVSDATKSALRRDAASRFPTGNSA
jgi:hypothetical protein